VRTGMGTVEGAGSTLFIDDARATGATRNTLTSFPSLGQRLFH